MTCVPQISATPVRYHASSCASCRTWASAWAMSTVDSMELAGCGGAPSGPPSPSPKPGAAPGAAPGGRPPKLAAGYLQLTQQQQSWSGVCGKARQPRLWGWAC